MTLAGCAVSATVPGPPDGDHHSVLTRPGARIGRILGNLGGGLGWRPPKPPHSWEHRCGISNSGLCLGRWPGRILQARVESVQGAGTPWRKVQFGSTETKFTFSMAADRTSIQGQRERGGRINTVTMKKVGPW